jgi:hypothetical protein
MTDGTLHPIARIEPQPSYRLLVTWASGDQSTVDFADDIRRGGIWAALRDETKFAQARVAYRGQVLEWPEPAGADGAPRIDVDVDGLYEMALRQREAMRQTPLVPAGSSEGRAV